MTNCDNQKPIRPYSDYNLFFQLEREYILQVRLGVKPEVGHSGVFDPEDKYYQGPPLPSRYKDLVLPCDWYIPGKAQKRKRRQRKSHGNIRFNDLSNIIAKAWRDADDETRSFCEYLSDIGTLRYKNATRAYKIASSAKLGPKQESICLQRFDKGKAFNIEVDCYGKEDSQKFRSSPPAKCDAAPSVIPCHQVQGLSLDMSRNTVFDEPRYNEYVRLYLSFLGSKVQAINRDSSEGLVDMEDDEIICLWNSVKN